MQFLWMWTCHPSLSCDAGDFLCMTWKKKFRFTTLWSMFAVVDIGCICRQLPCNSCDCEVAILPLSCDAGDFLCMTWRKQFRFTTPMFTVVDIRYICCKLSCNSCQVVILPLFCDAGDFPCMTWRKKFRFTTLWPMFTVVDIGCICG